MCGSGDSDRAERQRRVMAQLLEKEKALSLPEQLALLDAFLPRITTNITPEDMQTLIIECLPYLFGLTVSFNQCPMEGTCRSTTKELPEGPAEVLEFDVQTCAALMQAITED